MPECRGSTTCKQRLPWSSGTHLLEVNGVDQLLAAAVLDVHLKDTVSLLDDVLLLLVGHALETLLDLVEKSLGLVVSHCE